MRSTWVQVVCCVCLCGSVFAEVDAGRLDKARQLALSGQHDAAIPIYEGLIQEVVTAEGKKAWNLVYLWHELAVQHHTVGADDKAEMLYLQSLDLAESHRGAMDPTLVPSLRGLAALAAANGKMAAAEFFNRRALKIQEQVEGEDSEIARTLAELGLLLQMQERTADAEPFYRRALELGSDLEPTDIATIAGNLAALHAGRGDDEEALVLYRRALEARQEALGPEHPDLIKNLMQVAQLYERRQRHAAAAAMLERVLSIREKETPDDPTLSQLMSRIALLYHRQGRGTEANVNLEIAKAMLDAQCTGRERFPDCRQSILDYLEARSELGQDEPETAPPEPATAIATGNTPIEVSDLPPEQTPSPAPAPAQLESDPVAADPPVIDEPEIEAPEPATPQLESPNSTSGEKVHRVQVAARQVRAEALEILDRLRGDHPDLLADLAWRVFRADLEDRGIWHRVQIGEFDEVDAARELCAELLKRGEEGCWVLTTTD